MYYLARVLPNDLKISRGHILIWSVVRWIEYQTIQWKPPGDFSVNLFGVGLQPRRGGRLWIKWCNLTPLFGNWRQHKLQIFDDYLNLVKYESLMHCKTCTMIVINTRHVKHWLLRGLCWRDHKRNSHVLCFGIEHLTPRPPFSLT